MLSLQWVTIKDNNYTYSTDDMLYVSVEMNGLCEAKYETLMSEKEAMRHKLYRQ